MMLGVAGLTQGEERPVCPDYLVPCGLHGQGVIILRPRQGLHDPVQVLAGDFTFPSFLILLAQVPEQAVVDLGGREHGAYQVFFVFTIQHDLGGYDSKRYFTHLLPVVIRCIAG